MSDRLLSPYAERMGIVRLACPDGRMAYHMPFRAHLRGRPGFVHGGAIMGLLELVARVTVQDAVADPSVRIRIASCTTEFMRGGMPRDIFAVGDIIRLGRRLANVTVTAWQDDENRPIALAYAGLLMDSPTDPNG